MMTHDDVIAVVHAHRDGKAIQYRNKCGGIEWQDRVVNDLTFNLETYDYRIKPEPPKPREF